eukprot:CAMPEP_0206327208 /NCGR_PEP_ID=MMETSP0106_2-20121207/22024_1 /ASSEMBLY_ACC=CAM_ASM_000206 /TAXON_ID=81532 /ORGANISM="Acanthoeca-like sp., Strain 10tr" /LENGTH=47 /DNA_ID= /DNA_START= /DNA_END= /DNA_ORIENTATION=
MPSGHVRPHWSNWQRCIEHSVEYFGDVGDQLAVSQPIKAIAERWLHV